MNIHLVDLLRKYWLVLTLVGLISALIALLATFVITPAYEASVTVTVLPREEALATGAMVSANQAYAQTQRAVIMAPEVLRRTVDRLDLTKEEAPPTGIKAVARSVSGFLAGTLQFLKHGYVAQEPQPQAALSAVEDATTARVLENSNAIQIEVAWDDPAKAAKIADTVAEEYRSFVHDQGQAELRQMLADIQEEIAGRQVAFDTASNKLAAFKVAHGMASDDMAAPAGMRPAARTELAILQQKAAATDNELAYWRDVAEQTASKIPTKQDQVRILGAAAVPVYPSSPNKLLYTGVGLVIGILIGLAIAVGLELANKDVYTAHDVEQAVEAGVPVFNVDTRKV